jgi:hypothetical protein
MKQGKGFQWIALFLLFALLAAFGGGCGGGGSSSGGVDAPATVPDTGLKAGAGTGTIEFPTAFFDSPSSSNDNFSSVHDAPHARVLVLKSGETQVAIVSMELVQMGNAGDGGITDICKDVVSDITGTPPENIWVHSTHAITTPHPSNTEPYKTLYLAAVTAAITQAATDAMPLQQAVIGFGTGYSYVNQNRNVLMSDGKYHIGLNSGLPSNKVMTILKVANASTKAAIGFVISYGIKPTLIDNAQQSAHLRQISSDVPGYAATMMENEFGAPALFCMPATGDQIPLYDAFRAKDSGGGSVADNYDFSNDISLTTIIGYMEQYGTLMGNDAIGIAKTINPTEANPVLARTAKSFEWMSAGMGGTPAGLTEVPVDVIRVGDAAFVGFKQELNAASELELWAASPYAHTMLVAFMNGNSKYMPDASAYSLNTVEAGKTGFIIGAAENLVKTALELLNSLK